MAVKQTVTVLQGDDDVTIFNITETLAGVEGAKDLTDSWEAFIVVSESKEEEVPLILYDTSGSVWAVGQSPGVDGGTYKLGVTVAGNEQETAAIAWDATAADVEAAIVALSNVGSGEVTVTRSPLGDLYVVYFVGPLAGAAVTVEVTVQEATDGGEQEDVIVAGGASDGGDGIEITDAAEGQVTIQWDAFDIAVPDNHWHRLRIRHAPEALIGRTVSYGPFVIEDT